VNAEFFALAFTAALNPKLLAIDLLLIENRRPRTMFLCVLLGGLTVALTVGLLDVLVFHAVAINAQATVSAGADLAVGLFLLAVGSLLATGRPHGRRNASAQTRPDKKDGWARRALREPRFGLAALVGAIIGIPGASYLAALHNLVTGKSSTARRARAGAAGVKQSTVDQGALHGLMQRISTLGLELLEVRAVAPPPGR